MLACNSQIYFITSLGDIFNFVSPLVCAPWVKSSIKDAGYWGSRYRNL